MSDSWRIPSDWNSPPLVQPDCIDEKKWRKRCGLDCESAGGSPSDGKSHAGWIQNDDDDDGDECASASAIWRKIVMNFYDGNENAFLI